MWRIWRILGTIFKALFPIIVGIVLFFVLYLASGLTLSGKISQRYDELVAQYTHTVTIDWGDETTTITVREDRNWDINGQKDDFYNEQPFFFDKLFESDGNARLLESSFEKPMLPEQAERRGYKFLGLYGTEYGGVQYVNAQGYSLQRITEDLTIYALFEEVHA